MNPVAEPDTLTVDEYLEIEREAETKAEFRHGRRVEWVGATESHVLIIANSMTMLWPVFQAQGGRCFACDMRLRVTPDLYTYLDLILVDGQPEFEGDRQDILTNPRVVFEVLTPNTETYDRGEKFEYDTELESLTHDVLVAQDRSRVGWLTRGEAGRWVWQYAHGMSGVADVQEFDWQLPLADGYAAVISA